MNNLNLEFNQLSIIINVTIRLITVVIFILYLFPLFIKEAKVRNGLRLLRYELLLSGSIIFLVNISGLFIILFRYLGADLQNVTNLTTYFNTLGFLTYALLKLKIYTQKYSPENKKLHERFERIEVRELKKAKNKKLHK
jgi:hypothetical protein